MISAIYHYMKKVAVLCLALHPSVVFGEIHLPDIVGTNMVLQQQAHARIWGKATPQRTLTIKADWLKQPLTAKVDTDSTWQVLLPTPVASFQKHQIQISESPSSQVTIDNVLIGEVWFASGQSNMEMPLRGFWCCPVNGANEEIATAGEWCDRVRIAFIPKTGSREPQEEVKGPWLVPSPQTAPQMSAVAWHFAKMLTRVLNCPVGVIACAWGGASVEGWTPREKLLTYPDIQLEKQLNEGWNGRWWEWYTPLIMYNGMLYPLRHYTIRGFLWYQGEANVGKHDTYAQRLANMVSIWRSDFGDTANTLPFYFAEIAPWGGYEGISGALLRESQHHAARLIPNSEIICTNDLVEPHEVSNIHPAEKREVGYRLAYMALNKTYGFTSIACESPEFQRLEVHADVVELFFTHDEYGFSPWQDIEGFEWAFDGGDFIPVKGRLNETHKSILLPLPADYKSHEVELRYCFKAFQIGSLRGERHLPVVPFRTYFTLNK